MGNKGPVFDTLPYTIDLVYNEDYSATCAYRIKGTGNCAIHLTKRSLKEANHILASNFSDLTKHPEEQRRSPAFFRILQNFAESRLCRNHAKHFDQAALQWCEEYRQTYRDVADTLTRCLALPGTQVHGVPLKATTSMKPQVSVISVEVDERECESDVAGSVEPKQDEEVEDSDIDGVTTIEKPLCGTPRDILDPGLPEIRSIQRNLTMNQETIINRIAAKICEPVEGKSSKTGWIYLLRVPSLGQGMYKFGHTTSGPPKHDRWVRHEKCYGPMEEILTSMTPCAYRLEQIILLEFRNNEYQLHEPCKQCKPPGNEPDKKPPRHHELLRVEKDEQLKERLKQWVSFFKDGPYRKSGTLRQKILENLPPKDDDLKRAIQDLLKSKRRTSSAKKYPPSSKRQSQGSVRGPIFTDSHANVRPQTPTADDYAGITSNLEHLHLSPSSTPSKAPREVPIRRANSPSPSKDEDITETASVSNESRPLQSSTPTGTADSSTEDSCTV
ncbi:Uncharacterized protein PECH_002139 [Penicillium ucsense]|uniref:Bacteriophage T5 Orf172 DNA-binding domain-containing protein n=1 Tax=Penicillium ucsense TaxID=2839758 RepID=A0A8J8VXF7_9EURO|nr:Uncharacterized protein PECM_001287 [Penicillium ucsense]KAF7731282.1 Uncharacterized protein PECH_002139 [Penicillium ucsense]